MDEIRGHVVKFLKEPEGTRGNGFARIEYETSMGMVPAKMGGPFGQTMKVGDWFIAKGNLQEQTFRGTRETKCTASSIQPGLPATPDGASTFLRQTFARMDLGIAPGTIDFFVKKHGGTVVFAAERDPKLLLELTDDPKVYGERLLARWTERLTNRAAANLLVGAGLSNIVVLRVLDAFRDRTMEVLSRDPYEIVLVEGVTFQDAEILGRHMKIDANDPRRVAAGISSALVEFGSQGHTYAQLGDLKAGLGARRIDRDQVYGLADTGSGAETHGFILDLVGGSAVVQNSTLHDAELKVAKEIVSLHRRLPSADERTIAAASARVLSQRKYARLDDVQREAVARSVSAGFAILSGGPGTGKSTVSEAIAEIAEAVSPGPVILMAPTGTAAVRLGEATGREATTIHRRLGYRPDGVRSAFVHDAGNPLPAGCFVLVDEASMIDVETAAALVAAVPADGRLLLVGDRYQLPSVGAGSVLRDAVGARGADGNGLVYSELQKNYRSKDQYGIAQGAEQIKAGIVPTLDRTIRGGAAFFETPAPRIVDNVSALLLNAVDKLGLNPFDDAIVLCPQAPGPAGTHEINARLSRELNPEGEPIERVCHREGASAAERAVPVPRLGDRVMFTKNDAEIGAVNGDVGVLRRCRTEQVGRNSRGVLVVELEGGSIVELPVSRWRELSLAYAITGHKSQGKQYPVVIMPMTMHHKGMLERTLVYTEWTRAKNYVFLVGEREALDTAVRTVRSMDRRTRLGDYLTTALGGTPSPPKPLDAYVGSEDDGSTPAPMSAPMRRRIVRPAPSPVGPAPAAPPPPSSAAAAAGLGGSGVPPRSARLMTAIPRVRPRAQEPDAPVQTQASAARPAGLRPGAPPRVAGLRPPSAPTRTEPEIVPTGRGPRP